MFFLYTRVLQVEQICQMKINQKWIVARFGFDFFLFALTQNEKPVNIINSD